MALQARISLQQHQKLVMTPQMRQAIHILQISTQELHHLIDQEIEQNPFLEKITKSQIQGSVSSYFETNNTPDKIKEHPYSIQKDWRDISGNDYSLETNNKTIKNYFPLWDNIQEPPPSLHIHLQQQLRLSQLSLKQKKLGFVLIDMLDDAGRLPGNPDSLAQQLQIDTKTLETIRQILIFFDPPGLFCFTLIECLKAQLIDKKLYSPSMERLLNHLSLYEKGNFQKLARQCKVSLNQLKTMISTVQRLNPKPGKNTYNDPPLIRIADIIVERNEEENWIIKLNPKVAPYCRFNHSFFQRIKPKLTQNENDFIKPRIYSARWLSKTVQRRNNALLKVSSEIIRHQYSFLLQGQKELKPLVLRDIAKSVKMHESSISRLINQKYISTPQGVFELKFFFSSSIKNQEGKNHSSASIRHYIEKLILQENDQESAILSDEIIVSMLKKEGIHIARRTVAKYRKILKIPSSDQRRRLRNISSFHN